MPLAKRWSSFDLDSIAREGDNYGVYELGYARDVVYIGQGLIRRRLEAHYRDVDQKPKIKWYRCEYTGSKESAIRAERVEMKIYKDQYGSLPKYNKQHWHSP